MPKRLRRCVWYETENSILIAPFGFDDSVVHREKVWLPKSVLGIVSKDSGDWEIIIPDWLVVKHDLAKAPFEEPMNVEIPF
jgi:hypothetical protein